MMGHEESWLGHVRVEVKAGKQVQSLWTKFKAAKQQSDENNSAIEIINLLFCSYA